MSPEARCLIGRFPEEVEKIEHLLVKNEDFRDLSQDYCLCVRNLSLCEKYPEKYRELIDDYRVLLGDLEKEAIRFLKEDSEQPKES